ncbi:MAG: MaoC family dehydratase [Castellaniella sp.]|uniref:MaoC family dehydratase n=1 Tax=Castellaniella sp. TaxID=1955812 RepID=UPI00122866CF|nr:MaoC family dehydratase [Castellaniella sp.]TAN27746.1 MAG: MaoC family dehydratase [Castellaniella sp.]
MTNPTQLWPGEQVEFSKTVNECDFAFFSAISGDFDPIHVNEAYARGTAFGRRIAHGGLVMGLLSTVASLMSHRSMERGASGTPVSLGYDRIRFIRPVFVGDTLTARYTIEEVDEKAVRSRSKVEITNQEGELCLTGSHILKWVLKQ